MLKIYDYVCEDCNIKEERYVKNDDIQLCWKCGRQMKQKNTFQGMISGNFADKARVRKK